MPPKKRHPWQKPWKPGKKATPVKAPWNTKTRRVFVTIEIETSAKLGDLRTKDNWSFIPQFSKPVAVYVPYEILQVQANVAQK